MSRTAVRGAAAVAGIAAALAAAGAIVACSPELGETPSRCGPDGACPEGYDCIRGVCAVGGVEIPLEVVRVGNLRGVDLRVVPQASGVLVAWQTYAYSPEGAGFWAVRIDPTSNVSAPMRLVAPFEADEGLVEPYFDVLATGDTSLLVAVSAGPVDDAIEPRLITFDVSLPPEGQEEQGTSFRAAWSREVRMPTVGYGAVSRPRFAQVGDEVWLGYVQSRVASADGAGGGGAGGAGGGPGEAGGGPGGAGGATTSAGAGGDGGAGGAPGQGGAGAAPGQGGDAAETRQAGGGGGPDVDTIAELALFRLGVDGVPLESVACADPSCCQADVCVPARADLPVAVGVADAFATDAGAWFVIDDVRPSVMAFGLVEDELVTTVPEQALPTLAVPVEAEADRLLFLVPSARGGDQLPSDPVVGDASLNRLVIDGEAATVVDVGGLPPVRDVPRPAWVHREGRRSILVTPGSDVDAAELLVLTVDPATGQHAQFATIPRRSSLELAAVGAAEVGGTLYVVWVDAGDAAAVVRGEVLAAPP